MPPRARAASAGSNKRGQLKRDFASRKNAIGSASMTADLKHDLAMLQADHAIDNSLIESLVTSKSQARRHIAFWVRMMWVTNGAMIGVSALLAGFAIRALAHGGTMLWLLPFLIGLSAVLFFLSVLARQRQAAAAVKRVAQQHDLI